MKEETLKKANNLEYYIIEYSDLLRSRNADYGTMLINISCAYSNSRDEYHGRVDKKVWDKMLDVLEEERRKAYQEFDDLTDEPDETATDVSDAGQSKFITSTTAMAASSNLDKPHKKPWKDRTLERLISWMIYSATFCFLFVLAGLELPAREIIAYSLMLGLVVGSINNIERVMRELFKK